MLGVIKGTGADQLELDDGWRALGKRGQQGHLNGYPVATINRFYPTTPPHAVDHLQNIQALRNLGCTRVISLTACGSLKYFIPPGSLIVPEDVADFTGYTGTSIKDLSHPVANGRIIDPDFRQMVQNAVVPTGRYVKTEALISIRGPRFNTIAESRFFSRQRNFSAINMTTAPEASVCLELGIPYTILGYITDWDCGVSMIPTEAHRPTTYEDIKAQAAQIQPLVTESLSRVMAELKSLATRSIN